jgi:hypothetical protein
VTEHATNAPRNAVFISFRSADGGYAAAQIDGLLREVFGDRHVFRSARTIPVGAAFPDELDRALRQACVMVAVIGPQWATAVDPSSGSPRLADPDDWVRREIEYALAANIPLVPVILDGAQRLHANSVPPSIAGIADRQTVHFRSRFEAVDLRHLVESLREAVPSLSANHLFASVDPPAPGSVAALLLPEHAVVSFVGRSDELATLWSWLGAPDQLSMALLTGPGGAGKTRLAQVVAAEASECGWWAGVLSGQATVADARHLGRLDTNVLLIADEAEGDSDHIRDIISALCARDRRSRVRFLIVARSKGRWLDGLVEHTDDRVAESAASMLHLDLGPVDVDPEAECRRAMAAFGAWLGLPVSEGIADTAGHDNTTLSLHVRALISLLDGAGAPSALPPLTRLLHWEGHYWRRSASAYELPDPFRDRLDAVVLAATLFGGHDAARFERTLALLPELAGEPGHVLARYRTWVASMYPSQDRLAPSALRPDLLGEEYTAAALRARPGLVATAIPALAGYQHRRALTVLSRAASRHPELHDVLLEFLAADLPRMLTLAFTVIAELDQTEALDRAIAEALTSRGDVDIPMSLARFGLSRGALRQYPRAAAILQDRVINKLNVSAAAHRDGYLSAARALGLSETMRLDRMLANASTMALGLIKTRRVREALSLASSYTHLVVGVAEPAASARQGFGEPCSHTLGHLPARLVADLREALATEDLAIAREMSRLLAITAHCRLALDDPPGAVVDAQTSVALARRLSDAHPCGTPTPVGAAGLTAEEGAGLIAVCLAEDLRDSLIVARRAFAAAGDAARAEAAVAEADRRARDLSQLTVEAECTSADAVRLLGERTVALLEIAIDASRQITVANADLH